jgi:hypothetical protein
MIILSVLMDVSHKLRSELLKVNSGMELVSFRDNSLVSSKRTLLLITLHIAGLGRMIHKLRLPQRRRSGR